MTIFGAIIFASTILTSCGSKNEIKLAIDKSNPISGDITTYVEVIDDGTYEIQTEKSGTGDFEVETPFIVVALKSIKKFDINAPSGKNAIILELNVLDENETKVGSANFRCGEVEDIKNLLTSGNATQKFKFYSHVSPGTDFFKENDLTKANKISIKGNWEDIQGYDGTYSGLTENQSNQEIDNATSASGDCDEFLKGYEKFMDDYIVILENYKNDPTDASILSEYTSMMTEATAWSTKTADCAADAEFASKFAAIQMKIANAASNM